MPQGNFVKITKAKVTCSSTFAAKKNSCQMHMIYPRYAIWGCEGMTRCEVIPKSSKTSMKTQTCWHSHFLIYHKSVHDTTYSKKLKKKTLWPLFMDGFYCLKASTTSRRQFTFYHQVPTYSWYSFYRPWKDERLSRPCSHPVVLNTGSLDWKSNALTTRPLLLESTVCYIIGPS